jgi:hypothetical protein
LAAPDAAAQQCPPMPLSFHHVLPKMLRDRGKIHHLSTNVKPSLKKSLKHIKSMVLNYKICKSPCFDGKIHQRQHRILAVRLERRRAPRATWQRSSGNPPGGIFSGYGEIYEE